MAEDAGILIVGAGIGGLMTALALKDHPGSITVLERDPAPPLDRDPEEAFEHWCRPGVPQFRHSHMLLSRLRTTVRDHHPELLAELAQAGVHASTLDSMLPPAHAEHYSPEPGDDDLVHLWGRRATFEAVVRRHLTRFPRIRFVYDTKIESVSLLGGPSRRWVGGVKVSGPAGSEFMPVSCLVDATGKHGDVLKMVQSQGLHLEEEQVPVGYLYFCRHYRLEGPCDAPRRGTGGILDYLWFGTFFAEGDQFSIALACPEEERELCSAIRRADGFERVCRQMPALQPWLARSTPVSPVMGAGQLTNRWRELTTKGPNAVTNLFAVGDALIQTNPMYGRGCSAAAVQGQVLAEVLAGDVQPEQQLAVYQRRVRRLLRPYFDMALTADRLFRARSRVARGHAVSKEDRLLLWLYEAVLDPAAMEDRDVGRELVRGMQMREASPASRQVRLVSRMLWLAARRTWRREQAPPLVHGPDRKQVLESLGIVEASSPTTSRPSSDTATV